jgi:hypothetical protein
MQALLQTVPLAVPEVVAAIKGGKLTPQMEEQIAERVAKKALSNRQIARHATAIAAMSDKLTQATANAVNNHIARGMGVKVHPELSRRPEAPARRVSSRRTQRVGGGRKRVERKHPKKRRTRRMKKILRKRSY